MRLFISLAIRDNPQFPCAVLLVGEDYDICIFIMMLKRNTLKHKTHSKILLIKISA